MPETIYKQFNTATVCVSKIIGTYTDIQVVYNREEGPQGKHTAKRKEETPVTCMRQEATEKQREKGKISCIDNRN